MEHPRRSYWSRRIAELDPDTDFEEIVRILGTHEFPWDINRSLGFALFRTYAVPSVGMLLAETGEFTQRTQKRYDDTALILGTIAEDGFESVSSRTAIRRMNQMHNSYHISNDDMRYVLATFVVVPARWLAEFGWRETTDAEARATVNYYRVLGKYMNIKDVPQTFEEFETLLDEYEAANFEYTEGGRAVADATLNLLADFYPKPLRPLLNLFSRSVMDEPLLKAFHYRPPHPVGRWISRSILKARAYLLRFAPPRMKPLLVADLPDIRSYPNGFSISELGTFPASCPVQAPTSG